jgi:hypothetical protein
MRIAAAPFHAFGVDMGSRLAGPLDGDGWGGHA